MTRGGAWHARPGPRHLPCLATSPGSQTTSVCPPVPRLVSGNSIEEKLLKNGTKDLIREVAAQGNDYSMAFLTQVCLVQVQGRGRLSGASFVWEPHSCRVTSPLCTADHPGAV